MNVGYPTLRKEYKKYLAYRRKYRGKKTNKPIDQKTISDYYRWVEKMITEISIETPTPDQVMEWYEKEIQPYYKKNSLNQIVSSINHYLDMIEIDFHLPIITGEEIHIDLWSEEEINAIINEMRRDNNYRASSLSMVLRDTAQRINDVMNIDINDIEINYDKKGHHRVKIIVQKLGDITHYGKLTQQTINEIRKYIHTKRAKAIDGSNALWTSGYGKRLGDQSYRKELREYGVKVKIKKRIYPHLFRHYTLTQACKQGVHPKIIMNLYCIRNLKTIMRYSHPDEQMLQEEFDKVSNNHKSINKAIEIEQPNNHATNNLTKDRLKEVLLTKYITSEISEDQYKEGIERLDRLEIPA
jgi:integrase/recombinase XerD